MVRLSLFLLFGASELLLFNSIGLDIDGCCIQRNRHKLVGTRRRGKKREARPGNGEENWSFSLSLKKTAHGRVRVCLSSPYTHTPTHIESFLLLVPILLRFCVFPAVYVEHPQEMQSRHVSLLAIASLRLFLSGIFFFSIIIFF